MPAHQRVDVDVDPDGGVLLEVADVGVVAVRGAVDDPQLVVGHKDGAVADLRIALDAALEACHARDYAKAAYYLDLRKLSPADRAKQGPDLARQLEDLLDDTTFDIATLSRDPNGDISDGLRPAPELMNTT